ncbi:MAG TPA: 50S ribosomal protein L9 [Candidatus Polarisedimenticolia bacterium]|nr:50S ribosomal protein L9 [Candidatus Polarisedimenticolia bacterium]
MSMMRLILRTDVDPLGRRGDVVKVAPGYGRNYLLPKGLAYEYSDANIQRVKKERKLVEARLLKERQEAEDLARRIAAVSCTIVKKVGENDTLYGSVTSAEIAEALEKEGFVVDKRKVLLEEPIKALGIYAVPIRIHPEVPCELKVWVVKE